MYTRILTRKIHPTAAHRAHRASINTYTYAKQTDYHPDPKLSNSGNKMYVVSPKETTSYDVPGGAYATSDPYVMPHVVEPPERLPLSSTSPGPRHPSTTARVPQNPSGIGESSSVRYRSAPGAMSQGSYGGLGLMDHSTTTGQNMLGEKNEPSREEAGKLGLDKAWKTRK